MRRKLPPDPLLDLAGLSRRSHRGPGAPYKGHELNCTCL